MSAFQTWWFILSIVFSYWFYVSSLRALRGFQRGRSERTVRLAFRLSWVGIVFVVVQIVWLYPIAQRHGISIAPFIWLCLHGVLAFMIGSRVLELFRARRS